jgi:hypothetical protein
MGGAKKKGPAAAPAGGARKPKNSSDAKGRTNVKSHMRDAATVRLCSPMINENHRRL